jgi:hypothetical protein
MRKHFDLAMNAAAAYAFGGYVSGMAATINTTGYIDAAMTYTHGVLSRLLDDWMDSVARVKYRELQHVYEWPSRYHNYAETVGRPEFRLWRHTLSGRGRNKVASFRFMASHRPSPVNPALTKPDNGRRVKENVHIFVWKAPAMEYNYDITVEPKLANYLAYVATGEETRGGRDGGLAFIHKHKDGRSLAFSQGPVTFEAGGELTHLRFTSLFQYWWASMSEDEFDRHVRRRLESDMLNRSELASIIRTGNRKAMKRGSIVAQASKDSASWNQAAALAKADLDEKKNNYYIEQARQRRLKIYGE